MLLWSKRRPATGDMSSRAATPSKRGGKYLIDLYTTPCAQHKAGKWNNEQWQTIGRDLTYMQTRAVQSPKSDPSSPREQKCYTNDWIRLLGVINWVRGEREKRQEIKKPTSYVTQRLSVPAVGGVWFLIQSDSLDIWGMAWLEKWGFTVVIRS